MVCGEWHVVKADKVEDVLGTLAREHVHEVNKYFAIHCLKK